eukprot:gene18721-20610_t
MADSNRPDDQQQDEPVKDVFIELCHGLNLDSDSQEAAWASYKKIDERNVLEGDKLHWVACALYIACRQSSVPSADKEKTIEGNGVSLISLLKKTKLSHPQFFRKMKKWLDMANLGQKFRDKIDLLERNYSVSNIIFKKIEKIFYEMFKAPEDTPIRAAKSRTRKKQSCTVNELFNFCWTLFIRAKGNFPAISDDLVNSFHLLICCLDLMFTNTLTTKARRELLNPNFEGLPEEYSTKEFKEDELPSAINSICKQHDGIVIESKEINEHYWKPFIRKLFTNKILKGNSDNLTGILDTGNFDFNMKHLHQDYDEHIVSTGDFDERVFLGEDASHEVATPLKMNSSSALDIDQIGRSHLRRNLQDNFDQPSLAPLTPLTGRRYLKDKDGTPTGVTPISSATQSVSQLQNHLVGLKASPSDALIAMFDQCQRNPKEKLEKFVQQLAETFTAAYTRHSTDKSVPPSSTPEFAKNRLKMALVLFYKVLENVLKSEKKIHPDIDIGNLVEQELFVTTLMTCCLEIIIFSYNSQRTFPWIMHTFNLTAFHFYKVIEVVIRDEEMKQWLSRDVIKHLNRIEEKILEKLVWEENSPLYEALHADNDVIPTCESVCAGPPHPETTTIPALLISSARHPVYKISGDKVVGFPSINAQRSPIQPSLAERYSSPSGAENAKRNLFGSTTATTQASSSSATAQVASSATLSPARGIIYTFPISQMLQKGTKASATSVTYFVTLFNLREHINASSSKTACPLQGAGQRGPQYKWSFVASPNPSPNASPAKGRDLTSPQKFNLSTNASPAKIAKKTGSLGLFFRKVYHLASVRLLELCAKLGISFDLQRRIWTCIEFGLTNCVALMKDRHLDQMIMCAVYVMCKVTKEDKTFHEIMRCYRFQPQASSDVYRSVFISRKETPKPAEQDGKAPTTPVKTEKSMEELKLTPTRTTRSAAAKASAREEQKTPEKAKSSEPRPGKSEAKDLKSKPEFEEKFGDLIEFYNLVYVKEIKDFALKFAANAKSLEAPPLSPLPVRRQQRASPRKVSSNHELYLSPIRDVPVTPRSSVLYCIDESPAERLHDINRMISKRGSSSESRISKRRLSMVDGDEDGGANAAKRLPEHNSLQRRLKQVKED